MSQLPWYEIWEKFDAWYAKEENGVPCGECNRNTVDPPDWPDQQNKIRQLVEKAISANKKRK